MRLCGFGHLRGDIPPRQSNSLKFKTTLNVRVEIPPIPQWLAGWSLGVRGRVTADGFTFPCKPLHQGKKKRLKKYLAKNTPSIITSSPLRSVERFGTRSEASALTSRPFISVRVILALPMVLLFWHI